MLGRSSSDVNRIFFDRVIGNSTRPVAGILCRCKTAVVSDLVLSRALSGLPTRVWPSDRQPRSAWERASQQIMRLPSAASQASLRSPHRDGRQQSGDSFLPRSARAQLRRRHGESAGGPVRGRKPRRRLVQDQRGAHVRPHRHRRRMGQRSPQGAGYPTCISRRSIPPPGGFVMLGKGIGKSIRQSWESAS
jgi:hypothetical protein